MKFPLIEQLLNKHPNVVWEYRDDIQVSSIDRKRSHSNQARIGNPLVEEAVTEYTRAARNGDEFPAVVLYEDSPGVFVLIDGNNRLEAFIKTKKTVTDAYVILTESALERTLLTFECNKLNGRPSNEGDRLRQALTLHAEGMNVPDISESLNVSKSRVYAALTDREGRLRAEGLGMRTAWGKIEAQAIRVRLQNGFVMDKVFALAINLVSTFSLTSGEVAKLVSSTLENHSEGGQLAFIRAQIIRLEKDREASNAKRGRFSIPHKNFTAHLAHLSKNVVPSEIVQAMTADERDTTRTLINSSIRVLEKVLTEL